MPFLTVIVAGLKAISLMMTLAVATVGALVLVVVVVVVLEGALAFFGKNTNTPTAINTMATTAAIITKTFLFIYILIFLDL